MKRKSFICLVIVAFVTFPYAPIVLATSILGSAENFAVLAGMLDLTNTSATTITGDVGIHTAAALSNTGSITLTGAYHLGDNTTLTADNDLTTAYTALNNMQATTLVSNQLAGVTLTSGVYTFGGNPVAVLLTGMLALNAQGNNNAFWVFQIPNALTTGVGSSVVVSNFGSNGGNDDGVFRVVGSPAGIFGSTSFEGNILGLTSITLDNSAPILNGIALARNGTVTMDTNTISIVCPPGGPRYSGGLEFDESGNVEPAGSSGPTPVSEPVIMLFLGSGLVGLAGFARRKFKK